MPSEDEHMTRALAEAFNAGGLDAVRGHFDPDIEWHEDPSFPEAGVYRGIEAVLAYIRQFASEFTDLRYEVAQVAQSDEGVVANIDITGKGKASGAGFEVSAWWALAFRDGRVIRCHAYLDRDAAFSAAGQSAASHNAEVVRRFFDAYNARDENAWSDLIADDFSFESAFAGFKGRPYEGRSGFAQYFIDLEEAWSKFQVQADAIWDAGRDCVVADSRVSARGKGSGVEIDPSITVVYRLRDGRITEMETFSDRAAALDAVGLAT